MGNALPWLELLLKLTGVLIAAYGLRRQIRKERQEVKQEANTKTG